ncbi:class I SAM-dependent methyltransferase [Amycolatopsis regifaucium]|uniref:Methyltransferase n=1 Tax=Amycolatopsis regifaucium TaxID=546365 RepID=A0A154M5B1_9PSEU|nr:class I SAM-dependent methyltransferase [Amycolatopsis regifaucium]KZB79824.1 methyltransferase [Amycolatopsis regifaucium]OKA09858.1 SAM-dependent methyltransferase [Amycolatopsis regifaucium]SFJ33056.1 Ubiquinone/menaquinone biosynthesis C-methylase UbiE [Amycolatopsis regifaucium]
MTDIVNTAQAEAWNGYEGRHWAAHPERYDAVNEGFNETLFAAARIGERDRVLDIGCGNGQITRLAAVRAPLGSATGVDLSAPMLTTARARAEAEGVANVTFEQGDVQVFPFGEAVFDVALSRFAVMFFADPVAAFTNVRRALRPEGRLAFLCMTELAGTDLGVVFGALAPFLPTPTGEDGTGPTSFADPARIRSVLTDAGFVDVTCTRVEADQVWGSDVGDAAAFIADWGPVKYHLDQAGAEPADGAREALSAALRSFEGPGGVRLRGAAWSVTAAAGR